MDVLPANFRALHFFGLWCETDDQPWLVRYLWKPFVVSVIVSFACLQFAALILYDNSIDEATKCLFISLQFFDSCLKTRNFLRRRRRFIELLTKFRDRLCAPRDLDEIVAVAKYTRLVPLVFKLFLCLAYPTAAAFCLVPLFRWKADFPFEIYELAAKGDKLYFAVTYAYQVAAFAVNIAVHGALDTMLLTCAQIELACRRFVSHCSGEVRRATRIYMEHRRLIAEIVGHLEAIFADVVASFLFFSLVTMCTSIYNLSRLRAASFESIAFVMYLVCLLVQVFLYCWFGNELTLKSMEMSQTVYSSNWESWDPRKRRYFLYAMQASQKPLTVTFHGFFTVSMDVYVWVLKTSYAVYNLLLTVSSE